jgi:MFS family permease
MIPAAFAPIAEDYKVSKQQASYLTTSNTLLGGVTPLLITPFSNVYGRKPMYIVSPGTASAFYPVTHISRSSLLSQSLQTLALDTPRRMAGRLRLVSLRASDPAQRWLSVLPL